MQNQDTGDMPTKPKFIRSQRVFQLLAPPEWQRDALRPDLFRQRPDGSTETTLTSGSDRRTRWVPVADREQFFADPTIRRLCITVDAGVGKSTAIAQIAYLRHVRDPSHLAVPLPFDRLPPDANQYLDYVQGRPPAIVRRLQSIAGNAGFSDELAASLIRYKIRAGQFTLLVDALDQWREPGEARACAKALADFLAQHSTVRCVVSGRPYAIQRYWADLFQDTGPWEFAKLDVFREDEQREFLGPERFERLRRLEGEVMAIPRSLETILLIPADELVELRTLSDVYWRCTAAMLEKARQNSPRSLPGPLTLKLFALLAFEMACRCNFAGVTEKQDALSEFLGEVWLARQTELASDIKDRHEFDAKLGALGALNEMIDPGVWEVSAAQGPELTQIIWRSPTLQAMFAAIWLTRYATAQDREKLGRMVFVAGDPARKDWYEIWRLAAEMPQAARRDAVYAGSMAILYSPTPQPAPTLRSTEMIYRSWPTMLQLAGYLQGPKWSHQEVEEAMRLVRQGISPPRAGVSGAEATARDALRSFLQEFPEILRGANGPGPQQIAKDFEAGFRLVPPGPDDSLQSWMSAEGVGGARSGRVRHGAIGCRFQLSQNPVTNELYGLFDASHEQRFPDYKRHSAGARCPAIYLCWYDAWCIAAWLGGRLPTEEEWEYACRAQPGWQLAATRWWFGDDEGEMPRRAWYGANSNQHAANVGLPGHANRWGLCDMHGLVWEWTASWYRDDMEADQDQADAGATRVLRGGSFSDTAEDARSAARLCDHPAFTLLVSGARVARPLPVSS